MTELEEFLTKDLKYYREHWGGFWAYYERYCKGKSYKTAWYFYKKEYYKLQKKEEQRQKIIQQKLGEKL